ncbi:hypothetical protein FRC05_010149 [Tulasnella sp. 425]|nr:hypothetical protein FRC05_010149 [Tulasnella sp. 425]
MTTCGPVQKPSKHPIDLVRKPSKHPIARVSALWRAIIIDTPEFWATISNISSRASLELKIKRSKNSKLDFVYSPRASFHEPFLDGEHFMQLIGPHMWRCNSFRIRVFSDDERYDWVALNSPGSRVPQLTVESSDRSGTYLRGGFITGEVHNLCLENISIPWQSNCFPSLLSLQLTGAIEWRPSLYNLRSDRTQAAFHVVVDILKACPCLKVLKIGSLRGRFDTDADVVLKQDQFTSFQSLESLEMRGPASALFWQVLHKLHFPNLSKLYIYTTDSGPNSQKLTGVLCNNIGGQSLLQTIIYRANCERLNVFIGRGDLEGIKLQGANASGTSIDLDPLSRESSFSTALAEILRAIKSPVKVNVFGKVDD